MFPGNPTGKGQLPILTTKAEQEPILQVKIEGKTTPMVIDTGAAYTCISLNYAYHLPMSGKFAKIVEYLGETQLITYECPSLSTNQKHKCKKYLF